MNDWSQVAPAKRGEVVWEAREDSDGSMQLRASQDVSSLIDRNRELQADGFTGKFKNGAFQHVGFIPFEFFEKLKNDKGIDLHNPHHFRDVYKTLLNDPDYRDFRTSTGRV